MEQDRSQLVGWRSFRFGFGSGDSEGNTDLQEAQKDGTNHQEPIGDGCFVTQVDFDQLDQQ